MCKYQEEPYIILDCLCKFVGLSPSSGTLIPRVILENQKTVGIYMRTVKVYSTYELSQRKKKHFHLLGKMVNGLYL